MATETAKKRKKSGLYRLVSVILVLLVVFYVGFQAYRSIFGSVSTELVSRYSVYETIDTQGIVFRSETVIPAVNSGYVYYTVENGTHVAKDGVIASVYPAAEDGRLEQQIAAVDEQIAALRALHTDSSAGHLSLDLINTQLNSTVNELVRETEDGVFEAAGTAKNTLLSLLSKKQLVTGDTLDISGTLAQLTARRQELSAGYHQAVASVRAPIAGYFADHTDGYEEALAEVDPQSLTVEKMQTLLDLEPVETAPSCGKIVGGYEWFLGCVVPESYYNALAVGNSLSVRMSFVTDDEIPVTVEAVSKDNAGKLAVTLRCAYMSEALSTIRKEEVQLQLVKHTGLKVPKRAIVIGDDMQAGVYIRSGNVVAFRKIEQEYSEPADYVICKETDESGWLHLYDDVIVGGRGLYDGKIIR